MSQLDKPRVVHITKIKVDNIVLWGNINSDIKVYIHSEVTKFGINLPYITRLIDGFAVFRREVTQQFIPTEIILQKGDYAMMRVTSNNVSSYQFAHMCYFNGKDLIDINTNKPYQPIKEGRK